jgi:hypothetical protein
MTIIATKMGTITITMVTITMALKLAKVIIKNGQHLSKYTPHMPPNPPCTGPKSVSRLEHKAQLPTKRHHRHHRHHLWDTA